VIRGEKDSVRDIERALEIIKNTNSIEYASDRAKSFIEKGKNELKLLRDSTAKDALELIAEYAINRDF